MSFKKGLTLTELMVSVAVISLAIIVIAKSFRSINMAIQFSKDRAIATNLAQEKMQILKQMIYYKVLPSTSISYLEDFSPPIPYDNLYFPPETILEGGVYYKRYTYILPVVEVGNTIVEMPPNSPDTGMKKITVTVVWQSYSKKGKVQISSIYSNPDTVMANASISGRVRDSTTFLPIPGAFINIAEYLGARGVTDSNGNYFISITPGYYSLYCEARGYFPHFRQISVAPEQTLVLNIDLNKMGYSKMTGVVWLVDHPVISQIVGSTLAPSGFTQEYVEIFNPTTYPWLVNGNLGLRFQRIYDTSKKNISIEYLTDYIPSGGFYLFANTTPLVINGVLINADAIWSDSNSPSDFPYFNPPADPNIIPVVGDGPDEGGGAIELYRISDGKILDQVGWNRNYGASGKKIAPFYEKNPIPQNNGLQGGEQYVRYSSTWGVTSSYGPAYDSNDNSVDFYVYSSGIVISPRNSTFSAPSIAGTPAYGAIVSCSDGLSISTYAYRRGELRGYAYFELNEIATGTWTCLISSSSYSLIIDSFTSVAGSTTNLNSVFLTSLVDYGYITGMVTDAYGANITPAIKVVASDGNYTYVSNRRYIIPVTTSPINITVNPDNLNPSYVSVSSQNISIMPGEVKSGVDFVLYQGGRITGKVLIRGSTRPAPGVAVVIYDIYDVAKDQQITTNLGTFLTKVLSTGIYIVSPIVDSKEIVTPSTYSVNITNPGSIVFSTTFTVSNALGYISGSVYFNSSPIKTGVLIAVTTVTLPGTPPQIPMLSSFTLTGPPIYLASSNEEGKYIVEVRHSTNPTYNVYAYYPHPSGEGFNIYWAVRSNVSVWAGENRGGINFSW